jgi:hypothetical protein
MRTEKICGTVKRRITEEKGELAKIEEGRKEKKRRIRIATRAIRLCCDLDRNGVALPLVEGLRRNVASKGAFINQSR